MLKMWDEMGEVSMEHLKPKDLIYVWGHLRSYTKIDENGKHRMRHEVCNPEKEDLIFLMPIVVCRGNFK